MDKWLADLFDEEMEKEARLEKALDQLSEEELLEIINGDQEKTARILQSALGGALIGTPIGAGIGALANPEDRLRGAGRGALMGAAAGGTFGGISAAGQALGNAAGNHLIGTGKGAFDGLNRAMLADLGGNVAGLSGGIYGGAQAAKAVGRSLQKSDAKKKGKKYEEPGKVTAKEFVGTLKRNPNSQDLEGAFSAYEAATGKSRNTMSQKDINEYLDKTKVAFVVGLAREIAHTHHEVQKEAMVGLGVPVKEWPGKTFTPGITVGVPYGVSGQVRTTQGIPVGNHAIHPSAGVGLLGPNIGVTVSRREPDLKKALRKIDKERRSRPGYKEKMKAKIEDMKKNPDKYVLREKTAGKRGSLFRAGWHAGRFEATAKKAWKRLGKKQPKEFRDRGYAKKLGPAFRTGRFLGEHRNKLLVAAGAAPAVEGGRRLLKKTKSEK